MDRDEWDEWRTRRDDEPGAYWEVVAYVQNEYDSGEWDARLVEFIEEVENEAREIYDERSTSGLRDQRDLIGEHVEKQSQKFGRIHLRCSGFELIASKIQHRYSDCSGRVVKDLEVVPRDAFVPNPDGHGYQAPKGPLVLRPGTARDGYILEPTVQLLECYHMPTDVQMSYSFDALDISKNDTWEDVKARLDEQIDFWKELVQKDHQELKRLQARLEVYDVLLERLVKGRSLPWEEVEEAAKKAVQEPTYITDPPDDLFKGSGTKDRKQAKRHARELSELYNDPEEEIPEDHWSELHTMMDGETQGRSKIASIRNAFQDHPETEDPGTSERLAKACYFFFNSSLR